MPKFLIEAAYTAEGLKGLRRDKASGRKAAVTELIEAVGGHVEAMYFTLGKDDVVLITDLPSVVAAANVALTVSATGLVRTTTTALLSVEEADQALENSPDYRAPGPACGGRRAPGGRGAAPFARASESFRLRWNRSPAMRFALSRRLHAKRCPPRSKTLYFGTMPMRLMTPAWNA
jgi:uncharacterized protein with GYD domain